MELTFVSIRLLEAKLQSVEVWQLLRIVIAGLRTRGPHVNIIE